MVDHACNPSTQEAETEKPRDYEIKASLGLNSHLKASLDYIKKKKKKTLLKRKKKTKIYFLWKEKS